MILKRGLKADPATSDMIRSVQRLLTEMGYHPQGIDGIYGKNTEKAVVRFQESAALYADGIVGPATMEALEEAYLAHVVENTSPGSDASDGYEDRLTFVRCPADVYGEGYGHLYLRQDAAEAYETVLEKVHALGGILTSSGGKRALNAKVNSNRSATSFHYLGLALDLFVWSGMEDPQQDPYVVKLVDRQKRRFNVYVRCSSEDVPEQTVTDVVRYHQNDLGNRTSVSGRFQNLTALFREHGFESIAARRRFVDDGYPLAAEWWHFQYENALTPYVSTFGGELLKTYTKQRLSKSSPWRYRDRVFKVNWF